MCYEDWFEWEKAKEREALKETRQDMQRLKEQAPAKQTPSQETEKATPEAVL